MTGSEATPLFGRSSVPRTPIEWAGAAVLVFITWATLISFPPLPPLALDPSWRMALSYLNTTDLQFGTDIVFTYGPLGYLTASSATGFNFADHIVWQLGGNLVFAATIVGVGFSFKGIRLFFYYTYFLCFAIGYGDLFQMVMILIYALLLVHDRVLNRPLVTTAITTILGVLALLKFTNLLFAGFAVFCLLAWLASQKRWRPVLFVGGGFAGSFLIGWMLWGQSVGNLPGFIINSLSISDGYVDSMGVEESTAMFTCGLTSAIALVVYLTLHLPRHGDLPRALTAWAIAGAGAFLNWKHGFVRADGHVIAHFFFCLLFMATHRGLLLDTCLLPRLRTIAALVCTIACLIGIWLMTETTITNAYAELNRRIKTNLREVAHLGKTREETILRFQAMKRALRIPVLQALGNDGRRVDIMGHDIGYAVLNDTNYQPRPTLQGYAALTPRLAQLNEVFLADPDRAPELVLSRVQTIDDRLPSMADASALRYLYHHYEFILSQSGFLFWERRDFDPALDTKELIAESVVQWGETVTTPMRGNDMIWCELEINPSLLGRVRRFLYKPPAIFVQTDDGGGDQRRMRIAPAMARAGFLAYPYFTNNDNVQQHALGGTAPRLMCFTLEAAPEMLKFLDPEIVVRFYARPPMPTSVLKEMPDVVRFTALNRIPDRHESIMGVSLTNENGVDSLLVHAPSALYFDMRGDTRRLSGQFGLFEGAYTNPGETDGVEFSVEWQDPSGATRVLWSRLITPRTHAEDRGLQRFVVDVPEETGTLIMRTGIGPNNNPSWDWAFWHDVRFEK